MGIVKNENIVNSKCGSDLMAQELEKRMPKELMEKFQIFVSHKHADIDADKYRILWIHDTPNQVLQDDLIDGGWNMFHKFVFPSNWLMQIYINLYKLPWDRCIVLQNAIEPIEHKEKPKDTVRLIYTSAPNRGLNILYSAFDELCKHHDNLELVVCSSFSMYGLDNLDRTEYSDMIGKIMAHPNIKYYGYMPNDEVKKLLQDSHIFAYPSTHMETSCISLIEAMSAGCVCVHPNYAALPETAANFNAMYQYDPDATTHTEVFYSNLEQSIDTLNNPFLPDLLQKQKSYIDRFYNWNYRSAQWENLLQQIVYEHEGYPDEQ
jgi:UDP-glucose:(glucosyl)LPS alpha-1,2-glucosyltransferase